MGFLNWVLQKYGTKTQKRQYQIKRLKYQIRRTDRRIGELGEKYSNSKGYCCPSCACPEYSRLCAKNERREAWLLQLLRKDDALPKPEEAEKKGYVPPPEPQRQPVTNQTALDYIRSRSR